ncbi:efflux transporter periplasmic adaptor subunit [Parageobacillus thermoglucosidasius]|uniref:Efflux transporter periplasmic adaptor subunit n=1 Tax=Parageobacillus thermoglucosidasius TaxID=1426 RepID=A0A1B7KQ32_PARTM|nr:efflux RND transporter periplasmic adaptor subunit [Parageobacillus thermoglucosidasius]OAT72171.1 efflux transporter periplasmic adaptor subunit [Parageobacillus thermoglucosidasius]
MKKWVVIFFAAIVIIGGGVWFFAKGKEEPTMAQVQTASVQRGKLEVKVSGSGTVQPVTSTDIKATATKEVDEVLVSEGEKVKEGQELITFTDGSDAITAPADGTVTSLNVAEGERVANGQVVAHITNYDDLQVTVQIDELDIPKVKVGQTASIKVNAFPDTTYTGKVTSIANEGTVSNGVSTFDVTIHIDKPTNVKVGMTAEASILVQSKDNVLYVPIEAVHTVNGEKFVLVANPSSDGEDNVTQRTVKRQAVKTGINNEDYVEITEGLTEGEVVQLPRVSASSLNNEQMRVGRMMGGMGGMPGMGAPGGINRRIMNGGK